LTAGSASAASQSIPGGCGSASGSTASVCSNSGLLVYMFYVSERAGSQWGGRLTAQPRRCSQLTYLNGSRFVHFHLCNSNLVCGPEVSV